MRVRGWWRIRHAVTLSAAKDVRPWLAAMRSFALLRTTCTRLSLSPGSPVSQQLSGLVLSGLAVGSVYALVGLAFIMVNEATGVVNFATGQMVAIGCFLGVTTTLQIAFPLAPAYGLALAGMAFFGVVFYAVVFRPLQDRPVVTVIIGTVMIGIVIQ